MPESWWVPIVGASLRLIVAPFALVLRWPLRKLDEHLATQEQAKFESEIRNQASVLFTEYQSRVVPNQGVPFPPGFGNAVVTLECGALLHAKPIVDLFRAEIALRQYLPAISSMIIG